MNASIEILTERFMLRPLQTGDATHRYLGWLRDKDAQKFISAASHTHALADLESYIRERSGMGDVVFLGIFERASGLHIGNIKYEPVNSQAGYAVMGVLIGDVTYRGKGVTAEVLRATAHWLHAERNIRQILLGVSETNQAAIRAYEKAGFIVTKSAYLPSVPGALTMVCELGEPA